LRCAFRLILTAALIAVCFDIPKPLANGRGCRLLALALVLGLWGWAWLVPGVRLVLVPRLVDPAGRSAQGLAPAGWFR